MKFNWRTVFFITVLVFGSFGYGLKRVNAQNGLGYNIEVSPIKVDREIRRGGSFTQTFRVGNYSGKDQKLFVYVQDFAVTDELGTVSFFEDDNATSYALGKWIRVLEPEIFVQNGKVKEVDVVIDVPPKAESGGHYAAIFFQTEKPEQIKNGLSTISAVGRVASLLLISVPGDVIEKVNLTGFSSDKKVYWGTNPTVELSSLVKNGGNVHAIPIGVMFFQGGLNYTAENVIYNQPHTAVLPSAPARKISEQVKIDRDGIVPVIGRIHVNLLAKYGKFGQDISGKTVFWVIPIKFITMVFITILVVLFATWRVILSFKKVDEPHLRT